MGLAITPGSKRVQEVITVKRKNPYSQIDVNEVSIEVLSRSRVGQKPTVGMDVSKGELTLCLVWPDREFEGASSSCVMPISPSRLPSTPAATA